MSVAPSPVWFIPLTRRVDKATYPHFNIYPPHAQALVPFVEGAHRPETRPSHEEPETKVSLHSSTTTPIAPEHPTAAERVSGRPHGLTIISKQQEHFEEPPSLSSAPTVSPLRSCGSVPSVDGLDGQDSSSPRPRVLLAFDSFPSIETRMIQPGDETTEPLDMVSTGITRSQSLSVRPTTPKKRQSALVTQKIRALGATIESTEPVFDRPVRRSTSSLPISQATGA